MTEATLAAVSAARAAGRSLWRISSTVFTHVARWVEGSSPACERSPTGGKGQFVLKYGLTSAGDVRWYQRGWRVLIFACMLAPGPT